MKFFQKIAEFLRKKLPKKLDKNSNNNNSISTDKKNIVDSNFIVMSKKALSFIFKYLNKFLYNYLDQIRKKINFFKYTLKYYNGNCIQCLQSLINYVTAIIIRIVKISDIV